jgi:hypothetical protein
MLNNRILDWRDRQFLKLGKRLIRIASKRRVSFNQVSEDNFKQICDATNNIDNIHIIDELMDGYKWVKETVNK